MDYDYLSSIVSGYTNLSSLTSQTGSVLSGLSSLGDTVSSSLSGLNSFSGILDAAMKSAGVDEETAKDLQSIAAVKTKGGAESEARSNLIMQNYLYAALMQDTLQNSLTDSADFTSTLFQGLAVGSMMDDDSSSGNESLSQTLQNSTLNAISNLSAYKELLESEQFAG